MRSRFLKRLVLPGLLALVLVATVGGSNPDTFANNDGVRGLDRAIAAQGAHADALFGISGVVGTGVGLGANGRAVVYVFTESAGVSGIPGKLDGVTVVPQVTGKIAALHHQPGHCGGPPGSELDAICGEGGDPIPGVTVSPTSNLVTTEAGGTDSFTVVLDTRPTENVTIGISSDNTDEGIVDLASLIFTPDIWDSPQTVTVTGVDDAEPDGDVAYTIDTAAAVSADVAYAGLPVADVSVTNLDDDGVIEFDRPASIGTSSGTERLFNIEDDPKIFCSTGTLGARVTDGDSVFALSNAHIYALEGAMPIGNVSNARILQPGLVDLPTVCGTPDEVDAADIGNLAAWIRLQLDNTGTCTTANTATCNRVDAAIASTTAGDVGVATPLDGYGTPSPDTLSMDELFFRQTVLKYGRTTGQTEGKVWAIHVTVNIGYDTGVARFVEQIAIRGGGFSGGGDSGSLVVTKDGRHPIGLLFAGGGSLTFLNPIDAVLAELSDLPGVGDLTIDDGSQTPQ